MNKPDQTYISNLYEGTFSVGLDLKFNRITLDDPPAKGALKISLQPFLIHTDERVYLFDVGIGEFGEDTGPEIICGHLQDHGLTEYDITDIFVSHLHHDHIGGLAHRKNGYWDMAFPKANIWVSGKGWEQVTAKELWYDEEKTEFLQFLDARANLHFLDDEDHPFPEITTRTIGGHTEFHQVILFNDGEHKFMQAGDVVATTGHINRKFAAKYDFDPKMSMQRRQELSKLAFDEGYTILGFHEDTNPAFILPKYDEKTGYIIEPVETYVPSNASS